MQGYENVALAIVAACGITAFITMLVVITWGAISSAKEKKEAKREAEIRAEIARRANEEKRKKFIPWISQDHNRALAIVNRAIRKAMEESHES